MTRKTIIWGVMVLGCTVQAMSAATEDNPPEYMSKEDREMLKEEARDMFYHAYNAYMDNAYPADELMPLSCKGRYRNSEPDRGDIDSTLGNFSLTLVDTLDTLVVLGDLGEFENAVRLVVKDVTFDTDVIVSLFETNIRMLGGLLSGHILAEYLQLRADIMPWYRGELLKLAKDLGYRFLPAFNTTTGIPFGRINLRHGMKGVPAEMCRETCTACAGSMILEMAALSRLTGESIFEDKAQKAMDALWKMRHRGTDLMGSVLNVHSGDWVRRDSGVGAGIDSYYEYCLKAYILLGDEKYLGRFNKHYQAVMKYVSQGPMLLDVHMHRPNTNSKNFMDALLAFWPGLQVLKGDIKPAVETHEMLYQVMQRHNFIPEAFTTDFQVHWGHHPLRPEFLESTYFLYRATGDHYYLGVGRKVLKSLQTFARVPCGYAAVSDVRTNKHDDTMDSFVLSETLKYLYLLFAEPNDLVLDLDEFIFTTEGHLLPLTLAAVRTNVTSDLDRDIVQVDELGRTCPNSLHLFPASVRQPLRNMVEDVCPRRSLKRRLNASQFQANNLEHLKILSNMGITILTPAAGRVQVLHTFSNARTAQDAEEGLIFMQEMVELSKKQTEQSETRAQSVTYWRNDENPSREVTLLAGPAHFGPRLKDGKRITGIIEFAEPFEACDELTETEKLVGKIVMVSRGNCMFVEKARRIQKAGGIAGIVLDSVPGSSAADSPMFAMSGDGKDPDDVTIPVVFLFTSEAAQLVVAHIADNSLTVTIGDYTPRDEIQLNAPGDLSVFERLKGSLKDFLTRQVTPQNSALRTTASHGTTTITSYLSRSSVKPKNSDGSAWPIEYKINDFHLKAIVYERENFVKLGRTESSPPISKNPKFTNNFEKTWHTLKRNLVNEIYSSDEGFIILQLSKIKFQYKIVHKLRDLAIPVAMEKISILILMEWLLRELRDVEPDAKLRRKIVKNFRETSTKIGLEELLEKAATRRENSRKDATANEDSNDLTENLDFSSSSTTKTMSIDAIDDCTKSFTFDENYREIIELLNFNEKLKNEIFTKQEITEKNFYSESVDFKFFLISEIEKTSENIENNDDTVNNDESTIDDFTSMIIWNEFRAFVCREKGYVVIGVTENQKIRKNVETRKKIKLEGFEDIWQDLRQFIVNIINSHEEKAIKISLRNLRLHYEAVQLLRASYYKSDANIENMIIWYLCELSELNPEPDIVDILVARRKNPAGLSPNFEQLLKKFEKFATHEKTKDTKIRRDGSIKNLSIARMKNHRDDDEPVTREKAERLENSRKCQSIDETSKSRVVIDETRKSREIVETETGKIDEIVKKVSKDESSRLRERTERSKMSEKVNDERSSGDPMEEFKKPVWAPDVNKDGKFSNFHEKNDFSNDIYEYTTDYTIKTSDERDKTRRGSKRIDDDL